MLVVICFVVGFGLAYVNSITAPIIAKAAAETEEEAKKAVLPDGDGFTEVDDTSDLPEEVESAFTSDNDAGMVFKLVGAGYGGDVEIMVGISNDGTIAGTQVLDHSETVGLGARIAEEDFRSQFVGEDSSLADVSVISGSTISSKCFIDLVNAAFEAYATLGGEGV